VIPERLRFGLSQREVLALCMRAALFLAALLALFTDSLIMTSHQRIALMVSAVMLVSVGIAQTVFVVIDIMESRRALLIALPFDVITLSLLSFSLSRLHDPIFAIFLGLALVHAIGSRRDVAFAIGGLCVIGYLGGHIAAEVPEDWVSFVVLAFNSLGLLVLPVGFSVIFERQREQQASMEAAQADKVEVTTRLQHRLAELQAITEITEVIHSDLDFDRVGPLMLAILQKVLNVPSVCLMVIDKQKSETLFSASAGLAGTTTYSPDVHVDAATGLLRQGSSGHFSCITLMDHHNLMVVFCSDPEFVENFADEDRLVLQAVASELVVAVENSQLYKLTKRLSITDELTGLYNYRYLQTRLEEEFERARRYRKDLSMLMIDADDFKFFNDTHGHVAGDRALADLGALISGAVREVDLVARYGGEEFSVILPETDASGAFVVAEKIRESVANHSFADADGNPGVTLTISLGLASYPGHSNDRESLLREADDALYQAKNTGKNRVRAPEYRMSRASTRPTSEETR